MKIARFDTKGRVEETEIGSDGKIKTTVLGLARMCQVAKSRLGNKEVLSFLYINNGQVPPVLRKVIKLYVEGKINREEIEQKLNELAAKEDF